MGDTLRRAMEPSIQEAIDYLAVRRLQDAYADVVNRRAWAELDDLFVADAVVRVDKRDGEAVEIAGPAALGAFIGGAIEQYDFFEFVILNSRVFLDPHGDPNRATARVYMNELRHGRDSGRWSVAYGVYHDVYCRDTGRWWFARRDYHSLARTSPDFDVFPHPSVPF
jgi:hypothetical protein